MHRASPSEDLPIDEDQHESDAEARQIRGFDGSPQQSKGRAARGTGLVAESAVASDENWRKI